MVIWKRAKTIFYIPVYNSWKTFEWPLEYCSAKICLKIQPWVWLLSGSQTLTFFHMPCWGQFSSDEIDIRFTDHYHLSGPVFSIGFINPYFEAISPPSWIQEKVMIEAWLFVSVFQKSLWTCSNWKKIQQKTENEINFSLFTTFILKCWNPLLNFRAQFLSFYKIFSWYATFPHSFLCFSTLVFYEL